MSSYDLELNNVVKEFGSSRAVDQINLQIKKGEFLSLLGPSGCGKSTTLMMIAGFESTTSGEITIRGSRVDGLPPEKRNIGVVFQAYALFPHMSVRENVEYGLKMRKVPAAERKERATRMLDIVHMLSYAERNIKQLSGGQQQRVALARALVVEPDILLLDEPFSALDRKLREELQAEVKHLQRRLGITTIFVTHDQEEALLMSDRIAVMNAGRVEQCAAPVDLYKNPSSRFVASFIGRGNFVPYHERLAPGNGAGFSDKSTLFFRPEDVVRQSGKPSIRMDGRIESLYFHGATQLAEIRVPWIDSPVLIDVSQWGEEVREGNAIDFHLPEDALRAF